MRRILTIVCLLSAVVLSAKEVSLSLDSIDATLAEVAPHAKNFPPEFSSVAERKRVESDLRDLLVLLDAAVVQYPDEPELLFRDGFANAMGHNLDFEGCAEKYSAAFDRLLRLKPEDKKANFYYGAFLSATATRRKDSIRYLEKAVSLGVTDAHYTLASVYISFGDQTNALRHFKEYSKLHPDDTGVRKWISDIEGGEIRIVQKEGTPPGFDEMTKKTEPNQPSARGTGP